MTSNGMVPTFCSSNTAFFITQLYVEFGGSLHCRIDSIIAQHLKKSVRSDVMTNSIGDADDVHGEDPVLHVRPTVPDPS